nr:MAG TPA: hypothetical protein [Caudoviricetes sp.]
MAAARYIHTGLDFFYGLPLKILNLTMKDVSEAAKAERRRANGRKR